MSPAEHEVKVREMRQLAQRLMDEARGAPHHGMALDALILAFASIASAHHCCTASAAQALIQHAYMLFDEVAGRRQIEQMPAPVSTHLH